MKSIILVALIVLTSGCLHNSEEAAVAGGFGGDQPSGVPLNGEESSPSLHVVQMTDEDFTPNPLTINQGDIVRFVNDGSVGMWPASAVHPSHEEYPGSSMEKCGTSEEEMIFDSCGDVEPGQSYEFTFNERGTWRYHDHSSPTKFAAIVVE